MSVEDFGIMTGEKRTI